MQCGLLNKDYYLLTSTLRPVNCYVKVLPKDHPESEMIREKLSNYNIDLTEYIDMSITIGLEDSLSLSHTGQAVLSQHPYTSKLDLPLSLLNDMPINQNSNSNLKNADSNSAISTTTAESSRGPLRVRLNWRLTPDDRFILSFQQKPLSSSMARLQQQHLHLDQSFTPSQIFPNRIRSRVKLTLSPHLLLKNHLITRRSITFQSFHRKS